ncbi:MAG: Tex family protein [Bacteroidota bacterium]
MTEKYLQLISKEQNLSISSVKNTVKLLTEGATIPFISRYRKEATGSLDEVQIAAVQNHLQKLIDLDKRREAVLKSIGEQGFLTDELKSTINNALTINEIEDIYLPFKPKKKTRATIAKAKGLEPLAKIIFSQKEKDIEIKAESFINDQVESVEDALQGAGDIIAEWISEDQAARNIIRKLFHHEGVLYSKLVKAKIEEAEKYQDYFDYNGLLSKAPSHRILAILRGKNEGFLRISVSPPEEVALEYLEKIFIKSKSDSGNIVYEAIKDSYKRLLSPSIENEIIAHYKEKADIEAIRVFSENLRQLLLAPPLGEKRILAIDPGFRTGCKIVCIDEQGNLLMNDTIYPNAPQNDIKMSAKKITSTINAYKIEAIAIGNGTASRETENFIKHLKFEKDVKVFVVSENGASIYSASKTGREEFPQYDVTVRGSVSIGRRLMDPLAELVKIEPKSIGVGQYQHDVDQTLLQNSLDLIVESCVNMVGVNLNTSSKHLLRYISGLGPQLAQNIVDYRKENGPFKSRSEIKKVPRLGEKAFEQAAGFLRIPGAKNPLDNSAVHPERYNLVKKMASDSGCSVEELIGKTELKTKIELEKYVTAEVGIPTLEDIVAELTKPGRDPRKFAKVFEFADGIFSIKDLRTGMVLPGIVTNITNFGAFVDIGIKENGLVHISNLKNEFVSNPADVVSLHQHVKVKVIEIDVERKRIQLSMKDL